MPRNRDEQWPYSKGRRATKDRPSSRVRAYDREDIGRICMSLAWDRTPSGRPAEIALAEGVTREYARQLVDATVAEREIQILEGLTAAGRPKPVTLGELLDKYHAWIETQDRSDKTLDDKRRCRKFWLAALGSSVQVLDLTSSQAEKLAAAARRRAGHSPRWDRKRLSYLRAAVRWGQNKARLYEVNPLRGLEMPDYAPDTQDKVYDARESILLATPHEDVDWRVTLMASIICDTGRRRGAVLSISAERDLVVQDSRLHIIFRREFDKGRRSAVVPVSPDTHLLIAEALERTEVIESGWLIPEGRVEYADALDKPWNVDAATKSLHRAEDVLGIPKVPGRAWHGLKRLHVTKSWEESGGDAALVGDVTGNVDAKLLKDTYRQLNRTRTTAHVDRVRKRLKDEATATETDGEMA